MGFWMLQDASHNVRLTWSGAAEYVTFQPEQQEMFIIKHKVWVNSASFEVKSPEFDDWSGGCM